jgi:hypothetical protein
MSLLKLSKLKSMWGGSGNCGGLSSFLKSGWKVHDFDDPFPTFFLSSTTSLDNFLTILTTL